MLFDCTGTSKKMKVSLAEFPRLSMVSASKLGNAVDLSKEQDALMVKQAYDFVTKHAKHRVFR